MSYESLEETRKWRKEQEKKENIKYVDGISCMTLSNSGSLPDYEAMAKKLNDEFAEYADIVDSAISEHRK